MVGLLCSLGGKLLSVCCVIAWMDIDGNVQDDRYK